MKTYWILPDCTSFRKHRAFIYKRGPLIQGHKIGCPRLEHLLNFTLRYAWLQFVVFWLFTKLICSILKMKMTVLYSVYMGRDISYLH